MYFPSSIKQLAFNLTGSCTLPTAYGKAAAAPVTLPAPVATQTTVHDDNFKMQDIRYRCLVQCDIPEIKLMAEINLAWKEVAENESLWKKIGIGLQAPDLLNKEQVKKYYQTTQQQAHHCFDQEFLSDSFREELKGLYNSERIGDINQLREVCKARDTLVVWSTLQQAIGVGNENLSLDNLDTIEALFAKAKEFHGWCEQHQNQLLALQRLELNNNQLTSLPAEIGNLAALQELSLQNNQLTSLPAGIGNLAALQALDLYNNHLTSLPAVIGNLGALQALYLYNNQLTSLPAEIGNLVLQSFIYDNNLIISYQSLKLRRAIKAIFDRCYYAAEEGQV